MSIEPIDADELRALRRVADCAREARAMRSALALLRALIALPGLCRALAAEARQTRAALLADGWSESAADAAIRGELP